MSVPSVSCVRPWLQVVVAPQFKDGCTQPHGVQVVGPRSQTLRAWASVRLPMVSHDSAFGFRWLLIGRCFISSGSDGQKLSITALPSLYLCCCCCCCCCCLPVGRLVGRPTRLPSCVPQLGSITQVPKYICRQTPHLQTGNCESSESRARTKPPQTKTSMEIT